jgi:polysaccharide pyruvyl transferase WcaK-like protein
MKKIALSYTSAPLFSNNMGCNALTYGSLEVLSEAAQKLNVAFDYYLVGNPSNGIVPSELDSHCIHLIDHLPDLSLKGLIRCVFRRNYRQVKHCDEALSKADIFLDNAWGDSFSDIYGPARFESVMRQYHYALKRNKPLILLPQTIGPFKADNVRTQAAKVLRSAAAVFARDPISVQCAKELAPEIDVFETIDVAMFMPYQRRQIPDKKGLVIGVNPSGLLWKGGYTGQNQFGLKADYKILLRTIITRLLALEDVTVELIGHDIRGPNAGNGAEDYYICKLLQRQFPRCSVGPFFYSPVEAKSYISGMDMLIGSRMHCCIAAYSSGVPVFPLAYSRKFKGLFAEKLGYPYLSNLDADDINEVLAGVESFICQLPVIKVGFFRRTAVLNEYKTDLVNRLSSEISRLSQ